MLLKQIITQLDTELDRLQKLREIVADLLSPSVPIAPMADLLDTVAASEVPEPALLPEDEPSRIGSGRVRGVFRQRGTRVKRQRPAEPSALTSAIPAGPVVVSAQALARERDLRAKAQVPSSKQIEEPTLEAIGRDLAARWVTGPRGVGA